MTPMLAEVVITPPPPVILWQVVTQPFRVFKSTKTPVSHIFHQSVTFFYVTDSGDYCCCWTQYLLQLVLVVDANHTCNRVSSSLYLIILAINSCHMKNVYEFCLQLPQDVNVPRWNDPLYFAVCFVQYRAVYSNIGLRSSRLLWFDLKLAT